MCDGMGAVLAIWMCYGICVGAVSCMFAIAGLMSLMSPAAWPVLIAGLILCAWYWRGVLEVVSHSLLCTVSIVINVGLAGLGLSVTFASSYWLIRALAWLGVLAVASPLILLMLGCVGDAISTSWTARQTRTSTIRRAQGTPMQIHHRVITMHVKVAEEPAACDVVCTSIAGETVASVHADQDTTVQTLQQTIADQMALDTAEVKLVLPDGSFLANMAETASLAELLQQHCSSSLSIQA